MGGTMSDRVDDPVLVWLEDLRKTVLWASPEALIARRMAELIDPIGPDNEVPSGGCGTS